MLHQLKQCNFAIFSGCETRSLARKGFVQQQGAGEIFSVREEESVNLLKPTGHVMHQQFNIQQLYVLLTLYLCVLYLSENKQRLVPLTA